MSVVLIDSIPTLVHRPPPSVRTLFKALSWCQALETNIVDVDGEVCYSAEADLRQVQIAEAARGQSTCASVFARSVGIDGRPVHATGRISHADRVGVADTRSSDVCARTGGFAIFAIADRVITGTVKRCSPQSADDKHCDIHNP